MEPQKVKLVPMTAERDRLYFKEYENDPDVLPPPRLVQAGEVCYYEGRR